MSPASTGTQTSSHSLSSASKARFHNEHSNHMPVPIYDLARLLQPQQQSYPSQPPVPSNPSFPQTQPQGNAPYAMQNLNHFSVGVSFPSADGSTPSSLPMQVNPSLFWPPGLIQQTNRSNWQTPLPNKADTSRTANLLGPSGFPNFPNVSQLPNVNGPMGNAPDSGAQQAVDLPYLPPEYFTEISALNNANRSQPAPAPLPAANVNYGPSFPQLPIDNIEQATALLNQLAANHQQPDVPSSASLSLTVSWPHVPPPPPTNMNPMNPMAASDLHSQPNLTLQQFSPFFVPSNNPSFGPVPNVLPSQLLNPYPNPNAVSSAIPPYFPPVNSSSSSSGAVGPAPPNAKPPTALVDKKKRRPSRPKRPKRERGSQSFESTVVCGVLDPSVPVDAPDSEVKASGDTEQFSEFFGFKVRIFMAVRDPTRQTLYQSSDLVRLLKLRHTYLAMHLKRKKSACKGIWQAANVLFKRQSDKGIKSGSYFLSEEACREFKTYYENKKLSQDDDSIHSSTSE